MDVAWSINDPVLRDMYPVIFGAAMGHVGPSTKAPNLFSHDLSKFVPSHGAYKDCPEYFEMWHAGDSAA